MGTVMGKGQAEGYATVTAAAREALFPWVLDMRGRRVSDEDVSALCDDYE